MYTKGEWKVSFSGRSYSGYEQYWIKIDTNLVATMERTHDRNEAKGNADLIVAAVNACATINKENPVAVAEAIGDMYEALRQVLPWAKSWIQYLRDNIGQGQGQDADEWFRKADTALDKAEGKE